MALSAGATWEANGSTGSDSLNAGYFNGGGSSPGTDYSTGAPITCTDLVITATNTQVTSATIGFVAGHNRNGLRITAGTNFTPGLYEITAVSGGVATLSSACGTAGSTGGTARVGGPLASPGGVQALRSTVVSNVFVCNPGGSGSPTVYTTSNSSNVAGGKVSDGAGNSVWQGYSTNRTLYNSDPRPILRPSANSVTLMLDNSGGTTFSGFVVDNPSNFTSVTAFDLGFGGVVYGCKAASVATGFKATFAGFTAIQCLASACTTGFQSDGAGTGFFECVAASCTNNGFIFNSASGACVCCTAYGSAVNFSNSNYGVVYAFCTSGATPAGANDGFYSGAGSSIATFYRCAEYGAGRYGYNVNKRTNRVYACAAGGDGTANTLSSYPEQVVSVTALSGNPFTNSAGLDYGLNATAGAGAACRGVSFAAPGLSTTGYPDAGAAQHQDSPATNTYVINQTVNRYETESEG